MLREGEKHGRGLKRGWTVCEEKKNKEMLCSGSTKNARGGRKREEFNKRRGGVVPVGERKW